ncbi:MAG: SDR family oxidoreductase [Planctomycetaceae bacterium]|nr:SDR family oxidoreductase [Planctomycetaceae bacterium]
MDLNLTGQTAVIVGGASGIGHAIATEFVAEGGHVIILDRHPDCVAIAAALATSSCRAVGLTVDATQSASMQAAVTTITHEFGGCDHVVYAAGIGSGKFGFPFWNLTPDDWPRTVEVNLLGAVQTAHAFQEMLRRSAAGTLLFISSVAGQIGSQTDPPYSAAKAGLINFAQCAAKDLAPFGVRVNTICPGMIKTPLNESVYQAWANQQPPDQRMTYDTWAEAKIRQIVPLGRWQTPADIAAMTLFLASSRCQNVTGQTINVDGGFVMHS